MKIFHRHRWVEAGRRYNSPLHTTSVEGAGESLMVAFYGLTVIELRCEVCGDITHRRYPGDAGVSRGR